MSSDEKKLVSTDDHISVLGLSTRTHNALVRGGINSVGQLLKKLNREILPEIRNLGDKGVNEIFDSLKRVQVDETSEIASNGVIELVLDDPNELIHHYQRLSAAFANLQNQFLSWQLKIVNQEIELRRLHPQARLQNYTVQEWLQAAKNDPGNKDAMFVLENITTNSRNICDELDRVFKQKSERNVIITMMRYGFEPQTLETIGEHFKITRERVRQITTKVERLACLRVSNSSTLRMQSATLYAQEKGWHLSFDEWVEDISRSGLLGFWQPHSNLSKIDPVELFIALINLTYEHDVTTIPIPENLQFAIQLASNDLTDIPAKSARIRSTLSKPTKKLIHKQARFTGGIHARWLAVELDMEIQQIRDILQALGYKAISRDWFMPKHCEPKTTLSRNDVFHNAVQKALYYCGPLSVEHLSAGLRHSVSRTEFPAPPPDVLKQILDAYGYESDRHGEYIWTDEIFDKLSRGEEIIFECIAENGPVVHHSELAQAFIDSELSFPSLHATLNRTPLIERIDQGLYKKRNTEVTSSDIERAEAAANKVPIDLEVAFDKAGLILIHMTLGISAVATGEIFTEHLPNLAGEWDCFIDDENFQSLTVTEKHVRRLKDPFEYLDCQVEDRVTLIFNTWNRSVTIQKA